MECNGMGSSQLKDSSPTRAAEEAEEIPNGCVWPPIPYTCGFCRRQFRSAQALGGHMNVHRRDRARLIRSPPMPSSSTHHHPSILNLAIQSNYLKPIISSPCYSLSSAPFSPLLSLQSPTSSSSASAHEYHMWSIANKSVHGSSSSVSSFARKNGKDLDVDVEISLVGASKDIDLELRLGY